MTKFTSISGCKSFYTTTTYNKQPVTIVAMPESEIKKISIDMCTQPKLNPEKMLSTYEEVPYLLINCSFFGTNSGQSIWNLISNGTVYSRDVNANKWGIGVLKDPNREHPMNVGEYQNGPDTWEDYSTVYPLLILNNERQDVNKYSDIDYLAQRTCFGMFKCKDSGNCYYFAIIVEGNGCKLSTLQTIVEQNIKNDNQDIVWVCNLDGGGSSFMAIEGQRVSEGAPNSWQRAVDSVLCVWIGKTEDETETVEPPTEEVEDTSKTPTKGYRVQLGAFASYSNAKNYCTVIQSLARGQGLIDYSKAFVQKESDGLYHVQVGFFHFRENCQKVVDELESFGYDSYIRPVTVYL